METFKYCRNCNHLFVNNVLNCCETKCEIYSINTILNYKKLLNHNSNITYLIWKLYKLDAFYSFYNYITFNAIIKNIIKHLLQQNCTSNNDLIFYITYAYLLKNKRNINEKSHYDIISYKNNKNAFFIHEMHMLSLDFYFTVIHLSDFGISLTRWNKKIHNDKFVLNKYYINYLILLDYNICIKENLFYKQFESIINN